MDEAKFLDLIQDTVHVDIPLEDLEFNSGVY
jgi:hypothetical protein